MSETIRIKRGLDIKLRGKAEKSLLVVEPKTVALQPTDFIGLTPRLLVKEGDSVSIGTAVGCS